MLPSRTTVIYDACVLYPAAVRDLLLQVATTNLVHARWTERIHEEWIENLLVARPDLSRERLEKTRERMNTLPDCLVFGYEHLEPGLDLPDPNDRHVLAAALHGGAQAIVTFNLVDFPESVLGEHNVVVLHPDEFLTDLADLDPAIALDSARTVLRRLIRPPVSLEQYLAILRKNKLPEFAARMEALDWNR